MRGRYFSRLFADKVYQAATADGADRSGMTALTIPVITNFAVDAAMARRPGQHPVLRRGHRRIQGQCRAVLALTIALFAVIAPLIGLSWTPATAARIAMATTFGLRALLAVLIIANSDWNSQAGNCTTTRGCCTRARWG